MLHKMNAQGNLDGTLFYIKVFKIVQIIIKVTQILNIYKVESVINNDINKLRDFYKQFSTVILHNYN